MTGLIFVHPLLSFPPSFSPPGFASRWGGTFRRCWPGSSGGADLLRSSSDGLVSFSPCGFRPLRRRRRRHRLRRPRRRCCFAGGVPRVCLLSCRPAVVPTDLLADAASALAMVDFGPCLSPCGGGWAAVAAAPRRGGGLVNASYACDSILGHR